VSLQSLFTRGALAVTALALLSACQGAGHGRFGGDGGDAGQPSAAGTAPGSGRGGGEAGGGQAPGGASGDQSGRALARCHTDQLRGRITELGPAAGNRYAALVLTNDSDRSCRTYGWVGLQLAVAGGRSVPTRVVRTGAARHVVLRPGASSWSRLQWTVVPGAGEPDSGPCHPSPDALLVIPPDERAQLTTAWRYGPACSNGRITATPLAPGTGPAG
jgi:hypothetical protein